MGRIMTFVMSILTSISLGAIVGYFVYQATSGNRNFGMAAAVFTAGELWFLISILCLLGDILKKLPPPPPK